MAKSINSLTDLICELALVTRISGNDPIIDKALEDQRKESDPAKRKALAEEVNKQMAKECYNLPGSWTIWGTPHKAAVQGLNGSYILPDGSTSLDGGFAAGGFWLTGAWLDKAAG